MIDSSHFVLSQNTLKIIYISFHLSHLLCPPCVSAAQFETQQPTTLDGTPIHKRYEYKYSFKPPYLAQHDGSIPFFTYSGNVIASSDMVRITPSLKSRRGRIWTKRPINFDNWEVEYALRVQGPGKLGADGLVFWYTQFIGQEGPVYGSNDFWNGLALIFDSYDNDGKRNNPLVMAVINNGSYAYDHANDGQTQLMASCQRDFRNKPFPISVRVEYYNRVLTVAMTSGLAKVANFEPCLKITNLMLPPNGFFGMSAATGGLADDHDVLRFATHSLRPFSGNGGASNSPRQLSEDDMKHQKEFDQYQVDLERKKDEWRASHPGEKLPSEVDSVEDEQWISQSEKEMNQVYQAITSLHAEIQALSNKVASTCGGGGDLLRNQGQVDPGQQVPSIGDPNNFHALLNNQHEMINAAVDIKNYVVDVQAKAGQLLARPHQQQISSGDVSASTEMREGVNSMRRELSVSVSKLENQLKAVHQGLSATIVNSKCHCQTCSTNVVLIVALLVQLALIFAFIMYRENQQTVSKKFY